MPREVTQYQIKELTADVQSLKSDVKLVLENHLPHLKKICSAGYTDRELVVNDGIYRRQCGSSNPGRNYNEALALT